MFTLHFVVHRKGLAKINVDVREENVSLLNAKKKGTPRCFRSKTKFAAKRPLSVVWRVRCFHLDILHVFWVGAMNTKTTFANETVLRMSYLLLVLISPPSSKVIKSVVVYPSIIQSTYPNQWRRLTAAKRRTFQIEYGKTRTMTKERKMIYASSKHAVLSSRGHILYPAKIGSACFPGNSKQ